ncbi:MAG: alpha/beta fold hydrolase [Gemmatimonadota bacterium]
MADVTARNVRFHVQRLGDGPPTVVFIHGLVMDNLSSWYFTVATRAARGAGVVLYDLRGHGRSERPPTGYGVADMTADLAGVLDGLGLGGRPVELVGNSFGGTVALAFAIAQPERVRGLALVDAHVPDAAWGPRLAAELRLEGPDRDALIARHFSTWLGRHSERKRNRLAETARALVEGTSLTRDLAATPPLLDADLRAIRCPVLALYGERSSIRSHAVRLAEAVPHCRLHLVPGCTHSLIWEATAFLQAELVAWVQRPDPIPAAD